MKTINPIFIDIETTEKIPDDWHTNPTCIPIACIASKTGNITQVKYNYENLGEAMTDEQVIQFIQDLIKCTKMHTLVTFNGSGFDVRLLAQYAKLHSLELYEEVREMNMKRHVDIMFLAVCERGHPVSLEKVCTAMKVGKKSLVGGGLEAVSIWKIGGESYKRVLEYNKQDVELLYNLYYKMKNTSPGPQLSFLSKAGNIITFDVSVMTVNDAFHTEQYKTPLVPREQFIW